MEQKNELQHHGIPGMKWGIRRYQNKDGSLTPAGRKRADKLQKQYNELTNKKLTKQSKSTNKETPNKKKSVKDMTNEELITKTNRLNAEKNYIEAVRNREALNPKQVSKGREFVKKVMNDVVNPAATDVAKQLVKSFMVKTVNETLELDNDHKVYTNNKKKS